MYKFQYYPLEHNQIYGNLLGNSYFSVFTFILVVPFHSSHPYLFRYFQLYHILNTHLFLLTVIHHKTISPYLQQKKLSLMLLHLPIKYQYTTYIPIFFVCKYIYSSILIF